MSSLQDLVATSGASPKFTDVGDSVTGTVLSADVLQVRDYDTGAPAVWDDGRPQEQAVLSLATALRDPADPHDDGHRAVYIKSWGPQIKAFRAACASGGLPEPGDTFTATFIGLGVQVDRKKNAPKLFEYRVVKGSGLEGFTAVAPPAATPAAHQAPAVLPPVPAQAPVAAAPVAGEPTPAAKAQQFIALGLDDAQVASLTGLDVGVVAVLRAA